MTVDESAGADIGADNTIELVLPARTELAATLRVLAASLGADVGFTVDEIDDLRLALNEVFTSAADVDDPGDRRISVSFRPTPGRLEVIVFMVGPEPIVLDELAATILTSVVDDLDTTGGTLTFSKRAAEAVG